MNKEQNNVDYQYLDLLRDVLENGVVKSDRTGTGTKSIFGKMLSFKMKDGFPAITTKKLHFKSIVQELLWFIKGNTNIKYLVDNDVSIWNEWPWKNYLTNKNVDEPDLTVKEFAFKIKQDAEFAEKWGDCGPIYGKQWRNWETFESDGTGYASTSEPIDQISKLIHQLKTNPDSRRLMVSAWNVNDLDKMLLMPCHYGFQCWTRELTRKEKIDWLFENCYETGLERSIVEATWGDEDFHDEYYNVPKRALSLMYTIRSNDLFLGCPYNIVSYSLLLHMLAKSVNMIPDELKTIIGDSHIYLTHIDAVNEQLKREPYPLCRLLLKNNKTNIFDYNVDDFEFINYQSHPTIKAPIAI